MKERPILFSGAMVRAILDSSKTQTRRIVKKQPFVRPGKHDHRMGYVSGRAEKGDEIDGFYAHTTCAGGEWQAKCPYGQPGDQLWVRETFAWPGEEEYLYSADPDAQTLILHWKTNQNYPQIKWKPSIHMPRRASRIQLQITSVRVERLQDISQSDALAEGVTPEATDEAINAYRMLWESLNGPDSWLANPWVWAIEFKRVKP